jgi:hypothetical protein
MILVRRTTAAYVVEFRTAQDEALAISIARSETAVDPVFPGAMPYLFVPDVKPD